MSVPKIQANHVWNHGVIMSVLHRCDVVRDLFCVCGHRHQAPLRGRPSWFACKEGTQQLDRPGSIGCVEIMLTQKANASE